MVKSEPKRLSPRRKWALVLGAPLLAVLILTGGEALVGDGPERGAVAAQPLASGYGPSTYAEALARANRAVDLGLERVANDEAQWLRHESLARGLFLRSRLNGDFSDLAAAVDAVHSALDLAPTSSGPFLSWATIGMSSHRLADTEAALARLDKVAVSPTLPEQSEIAALRGDLAFYRGDMGRAEGAYLRSIRLEESSGASIRMARLAKARADYDEADRWLIRSIASGGAPTPQMVAQVAMHRGGIELARGDHDAARKHFQTADSQWRGYWLAEAHLAQARALDGDLTGAITQLRALARKSNSPEIMDALAMYLRADGKYPESDKWISLSRGLWRERLARLPEAAIGHALEHELAFGDPGRAVDLAKQNLAIRPYGEADLLMAQAFKKAGDFKRARLHINRAKAKGWVSAPLYAVESEVLSVLGKIDQANAARDRALAINPRIFDPETGLVWFSHG